MKVTKRQTGIVMLTLIGVALVWEVVAVAIGQAATISEWTWALAVNYPLVPFLVGVLMGHLFWQRRNCINCGCNPIRKEAVVKVCRMCSDCKRELEGLRSAPGSFATIEPGAPDWRPAEDTLPACQVCGTRYRAASDAESHGEGRCTPEGA